MATKKAAKTSGKPTKADLEKENQELKVKVETQNWEIVEHKKSIAGLAEELRQARAKITKLQKQS